MRSSPTPSDSALPSLRGVKLFSIRTEPTVLNIESYTLGNENFRTVLWTGNNLQVTLMTIPVGGDVGLEQHMGIDQFLRIEEGMAQVMMGDSQDKLDFVRDVEDDYAIFVPNANTTINAVTAAMPYPICTSFCFFFVRNFSFSSIMPRIFLTTRSSSCSTM